MPHDERYGAVPLKIISDSRVDRRERYEAALMLIRPDRFIAWAPDGDVDNATEILQRSSGQSLSSADLAVFWKPSKMELLRPASRASFEYSNIF
jgi:hypothetical protein